MTRNLKPQPRLLESRYRSPAREFAEGFAWFVALIAVVAFVIWWAGDFEYVLPGLLGGR